jgi:hypothetical protein
VPERGKKRFNIYHLEAVEIFFSGPDLQKKKTLQTEYISGFRRFQNGFSANVQPMEVNDI